MVARVKSHKGRKESRCCEPWNIIDALEIHREKLVRNDVNLCTILTYLKIIIFISIDSMTHSTSLTRPRVIISRLKPPPRW
ncbi:hypothetical protein PUN28_015645 [Cardiocondyla obscurior]|uniref:Uncharacterized protein n=1 Tax=Cardiocondyla obscurior TaxID=286306 RepID=A0AAW2EU52_9HYME